MAQTFVVVGAGLAGARAVEALRGSGVEGRVLLVGDEPELPYERPPLSKDFLAGKTDREHLEVLPAAWYADNDVELVLGRRAVRLDRAARTVELDDARGLPYDRLLLATGSAPRRLKLPGNELGGVHYLRRVRHSEALRTVLSVGGDAPLVVIGAGWIGLEVAAVARTSGMAVTILEAAPTPLHAVLGEQVGEAFAALHRAHGVDVRTGVGVAELVGAGTVEGVRLADGSVVPAGAVLVGVGIRPLSDLAEAAGLACDNGVLVDTGLRTDDETVWAAGDVANAENAWAGRRLRVEHFANANDQGPLVGRAMAGEQVRWGKPPYFWSDQYDMGLEYRGWADPRATTTVVRGRPEDGTWTAFWLDGDVVAAGMHVNDWDRAGDVKSLVADRARVDVAALADPGTGLDAVRLG